MMPARDPWESADVEVLSGGGADGRLTRLAGSASGRARRRAWVAVVAVGLAGLTLAAFPPFPGDPPGPEPPPAPIAWTGDLWYDVTPKGLVVNVPLRADSGRWVVRSGAAEPGVRLSGDPTTAVAPGAPSPARLLLSVDCGQALPAPRAAELTLAAVPWPDGGPGQSVRVDPPWFTASWDDALHTACGVRSAAGAVTVTGLTARADGGQVATTIRMANVSEAAARVLVAGSAVVAVSARPTRLAGPKGVVLRPGEQVELAVAWTPASCPPRVSARGPVLRTEVTTATSARTVLAAFDAGFDARWLSALAQTCGP